MAAAPRLRDRLRQALVQQQAVGQAGQRVARGEVLQPLFRLDPRRHVLHERQDRHDLCRRRRAARSGTTRTRWCRRRWRWLRVRPVARGSSPVMRRSTRPAKLSRSSSCSSGLSASGMPRISSRRQPKMFSACGDQRTSRKSRSHSSTASGVLLMCDGEHPVGALQLVLVALLVVDVGVHRVDADHVALGVAVAARSAPTPSAPEPSGCTSCFSVDTVSPVSTRSSSGPSWFARSLPTTSAKLRPVQLLAALAQPFLVVPIEEAVAIVAVDVRHARRHVVHDEAQRRLGIAQRLLRLLQAVDVVHQHERAVHFARRPRRPAPRGWSSSGARRWRRAPGGRTRSTRRPCARVSIACALW